MTIEELKKFFGGHDHVFYYIQNRLNKGGAESWQVHAVLDSNKWNAYAVDGYSNCYSSNAQDTSFDAACALLKELLERVWNKGEESGDLRY